VSLHGTRPWHQFEFSHGLGSGWVLLAIDNVQRTNLEKLHSETHPLQRLCEKVIGVRKDTNMIATQYSTASEATGCQHSIIPRTLKTVVECWHPVASLAVLY